MKFFLIFLTFSISLLGANTLKVNSSIKIFDNYKYETPHGRQMKVPRMTKLVVVAFEKDTGALVNDYLNTKSKYYLQKNRSIFIADINKMPSIITKMFALPKMKKYKHLLYLHYGTKFEKVIPAKEEQITLIRLNNGIVSNISFIKNAQDLKSAIEN